MSKVSAYVIPNKIEKGLILIDEKSVTPMETTGR
jgi:hypothetical protein